MSDRKRFSEARLSKILAGAAVLILSAILLSAHSKARAEAPGETESVDLHIICYNIAGLPDAITARRRFPPLEKRFHAIAERIKGYDILGLQEVFVKEREIIESKLPNHYLARGTDTRGYGKIGGGIYTFSKWPIPKSVFQAWEESGGADSMSHKGFVGATTQITDSLALDVYNLHAQAGGEQENKEIRLKQYEQLFKGMESFSFGQGRPILLMGDFNCKKHYDEAMNVFAAKGFQHLTSELKENDHIFFHPNGSGWSIDVHSIQTLFPEREDGQRLSDHLAVEAIATLTKK